MSDRDASFRRGAVAWIAGATVLSLLAGGVVGALGEDIGSPDSLGADGFSRSALGHRAFRDLLGRLGIPVVVSRRDSGWKSSAAGVLLVLEPERTEGLRKMISESRAAVLALPKWRGEAHPLQGGWVGSVAPVPLSSVERVLAEAGVDAKVRRVRGGGTGWRGGGTPAIREAQLLEGPGLVPVLRCDEGVLVADVPHPSGRARRLRVLSDPDLLANHGVWRGGNAEIAVAAVEYLRSGSGAAVLDETVHGHRRSPGLWREALSFPLGLASLHAVLLAGLVVLAGSRRFGAPLPPPPALEPGKRFLVENTARLLRAGGHSRDVLARYWRATLQEVAEALRAPGTPGSPETAAFLDRAGRSRGAGEGASELGAEVRAVAGDRGSDAGAIVAAATRVRAWKERMTRGH